MSKDQRPFVPKTAIDFQKLKLDRLMANPDKPVIIPDLPKERKGFSVPEFVRNVMGSSAGAGSGEFHVYRHLRRKEYTRQKAIEGKAEKERLDEEFHNKLEENRKILEEKTAKKRAKRLKRKEKLKNKSRKKLKKAEIDNQDKKESSSERESSEEENSNSEQEDSEMHYSSNENNQKSILDFPSGNEKEDSQENSSKQENLDELSNPENKETSGDF